ncbi:MAG: YggU family protein [Candidatus Scalindua sp. AMX11]|nr:MAG: YggU family protein [Candidatus Scalindua sp.]NOG83205.1 YggU family protein [Planctomycetota bacterium]RZV77570.1 MAG: YggU family protein [Candidatus Scalindua sp. SCAELEC01]TDE64587.1 MAG: YggU family protein [Candidatus Scalindua sp. AMX11]GJQ58637.1 MAG: hypothetical protein SCALA701_14380 [Candidatus Scalindua sp.]
MIEIREKNDGIVIPIKVQPNSSQERIIGEYNKQLKVAVSVPPEKGKANKAIVKIIAKWLKRKNSDIEIIAGKRSKEKEIFVRNFMKKDLDKFVTYLVLPDRSQTR